MATSKEFSKEIADITECSICSEPFKEPKVLPCIHTFCLQCLQAYGKDKSTGDEMSCPLCREKFTVPAGGFNNLPKNHFMNQLLRLNKFQLSPGESNERSIVCEWCTGVAEPTAAKVYCIQCGQHLCADCEMRHKNIRCSRDHELMKLADKPKADQLIKMTPIYCETHRNDVVKFYCYDCKMVACVVCYVDEHNTHKSSDVQKTANLFREQLLDDIQKVLSCTCQRKEELKQIVSDQDGFIKKVEATRHEISHKYDELKILLDLHQIQLTEELDSFRDKSLKEFEIRRDEVERQCVILESFERYCTEMREKGTSVDIARAAHDLHERADNLLKMQEKFTSFNKGFTVGITFSPSAQDASINLIGNSSFVFKHKNDQDDVVCDIFIIRDPLTKTSNSEQQGINSPTGTCVETFGNISYPAQPVVPSQLFQPHNPFYSSPPFYVRQQQPTGQRQPMSFYVQQQPSMKEDMQQQQPRQQRRPPTGLCMKQPQEKSPQAINQQKPERQRQLTQQRQCQEQSTKQLQLIDNKHDEKSADYYEPDYCIRTDVCTEPVHQLPQNHRSVQYSDLEVQIPQQYSIPNIFGGPDVEVPQQYSKLWGRPVHPKK